MLIGIIGIIGTVIFGALVLRPPKHEVLKHGVIAVANVPYVLGHIFSNRPEGVFAPENYGRHTGGLWRNIDQPLIDDGYVLFTRFDTVKKRPVLRLMHLSDGRTIHQYEPDIQAVNARSNVVSAQIDFPRDRNVRRNLMMHPLLMPDGGVITHDTSPLSRFDACGHLEWMVDGIFHHSLERDSDGNLWAAFRYPHSEVPDVSPTFLDEGFMQISPEGKVLYRARIIDILDSNGLGWMWRSHPYTDDPFHLNDVQPVLSSSLYWQKGDVFLSLRNFSVILLYRPSTGKVIWKKIGPWAMQHDVSILDDHRLSVFDNHWRTAAPERGQEDGGKVDGVNRVAVYDFSTDSVSFPLDDAMRKMNVHTRAQGRATPLPGGDFVVEETEGGRLMRLSPDGTVRWLYDSATPDHRRLVLRWSRYIDPTAEAEGLRQAEGAKCG